VPVSIFEALRNDRDERMSTVTTSPVIVSHRRGRAASVQTCARMAGLFFLLSAVGGGVGEFKEQDALAASGISPA
jgi:hypothetical protein